MEPVFSIVTVCYNSAATIERTLRSVQSQTWPHVQHIIIDGASKDDTLKVVERNSQRVAIVKSEPDKGIYDAMNKGVALATGDYIAFLNADDVYRDGNVLAEVAQVIQSGNFDAVFGDVEFFSAAEPDVVVRRFDSGRFRPDRLAWGWMPAHPALFLKRQVFERVGSFNPTYRIAGDFEFIARAFHAGNLVWRYLPQPLVRMQLGGASTGGVRSTVKLNGEMKRALRSNGIRTSWPMLLSRYPAKVMEFIRPRLQRKRKASS